MNIDQLKQCKESEDKIEFKKAKGGSFSFNGHSKKASKDRRKCICGYVVAFANEGGGSLVLGMTDNFPHTVTGTKQSEGATGKLASDIYNETGIRVTTQELYENTNRVLVIKIPSRPQGKLYKFEDVPLMRLGEELRVMSDEKIISIYQEQELDFSHLICERSNFK